MQLNNLKSKIRRSLGRGGLNISVALDVLCDRAESPPKEDGKSSSPVVSVVEPKVNKN